MALAHFMMLIHEFLNKDPYIVPEEAPLIILDRKSAVCMANYGKDTKHKRHIWRRMNFVRNGENFKMHNIYWCVGGLKLADISTKNVGKHDLTPRMKYIMVILDNWDITLVQEGWKNTGYSVEQEFCMTRWVWVEDSTKSVWNVCIKVWYMKRTLKNVYSKKTMFFWMENSVKGKQCINIESKILDLTI